MVRTRVPSLEGPETMGSMRQSTHPRLKWGPTWLPCRAQRRRGLTRPPFWPQSLVSFPVTKIPGMAPCEASMTATLGQAVTFTVIWLGCTPSPMMLGTGHTQRRPPPAPPPPPLRHSWWTAGYSAALESASSSSPAPAKSILRNQSLCLEPTNSLILLTYRVLGAWDTVRSDPRVPRMKAPPATSLPFVTAGSKMPQVEGSVSYLNDRSPHTQVGGVDTMLCAKMNSPEGHVTL